MPQSDQSSTKNEIMQPARLKDPYSDYIERIVAEFRDLAEAVEGIHEVETR